MDSPFAARWDPTEGCEVVDYGWIGEDKHGIWLSIHPDVAFVQNPELWEVHDRFALIRRPGLAEVETYSAFEYQCHEAMYIAYERVNNGQASSNDTSKD